MALRLEMSPVEIHIPSRHGGKTLGGRMEKLE